MSVANPGSNRSLLAAGAIAGPLYVVIGLIEGLVRPGFDFTKHDLSVLANGDWGWVHSALLVGTGVLTIAGAAGVRRALRGGTGGTWGPLLLGLYGLGLAGAGFFAADPAYGFPPGTPADYHAVSWHGVLHLVCGAIGFLGLIAACFVLARRFGESGQGGWAAASRVTGAFYLLAFVGIAAGSQQGGVIGTTVILVFSAAVVLGWLWITVTCLKVPVSALNQLA